MSDIFVSYARNDRSRVQPLVRLLEDNGFSVWWDREIIPGSSFEDVIDEQLLQAKLVVVVWTKDSIQSDWVQAEASDALDRGILLPVLLENVRIPVAFRRKQSVNLVGWPRQVDETELERFLEAAFVGLGKPIDGLTLPTRQPRWWFGAVAGLVLVIIGVLFFVNQEQEQSTHRIVPVASISVLPFTSEVEDDSGLYDGLAYEVSTLLRRSSALQVSSAEQIESYLTEVLAGRLPGFGTSHRLLGRIDQNGQLLVELVASGTDRRVWKGEYQLESEELPDTVNEIARTVANQFNLSLPVEAEDIAASTYLKYLKAQSDLRQSLSPDSLRSAKSKFEEVVKEEPRFTQAFAGLCRTELALYRENQALETYEAAERHCHRANTLNNSDSSVYIALGELYRESGKLVESVDNLRTALRLTPFSTTAMRELSQTLSEQGKFDAAESQLQNALQIEPEFWKNHWLLGSFYFVQGDYGNAIERFRVQSELATDNSAALNNLGAAHYMLEQFEDAIGAWESIADLDQYHRTVSNLGSAYFFERKFVQAAAMYERAARLAPDNHEYWGNLGEAQRYAEIDGYEKHYERALDLALVRLDINPLEVSVRSVVAHYHAALGQMAAADAIISQLKEPELKEVYVMYDIARTLILLGRRDEASRAVEELKSMGYSETLLMRDANFDGLNLRGAE